MIELFACAASLCTFARSSFSLQDLRKIKILGYLKIVSSEELCSIDTTELLRSWQEFTSAMSQVWDKNHTFPVALSVVSLSSPASVYTPS